ncbi:MAG: hypothetical protein ACREAG_08790 [Nitrosopumilaceae archaeon]
MSQEGAEIQPVYDVAQFGEDVIFLFNDLLDSIAVQSQRLMRPGEVNYGSATIEVTANAGATSSRSIVYSTMIDMPAWIFVVAPILLTRVIVGAGNTVTLDVRLRIAVGPTPGSLVGLNQVIYDQSFNRPAIAADETETWHFPQVGYQRLLEQHSWITVQVDYTSTRTAGAALTEFFFQMSRANNLRSTLFVHLHPAINHAEIVLGSVKKT